MCSLEQFKINLKSLEDEETSFAYDLEDDYFNALDDSELRHGALHVSVSIRKATGFFELDFHTTGVIVIPCDSTDAWTVAAYEKDVEEIETIADPWDHIISIKKEYHGIRIPGHKKNTAIYRMFIPQIVQNWDIITRHCPSARKLETDIRQWMSKA